MKWKVNKEYKTQSWFFKYSPETFSFINKENKKSVKLMKLEIKIEQLQQMPPK